MDRIIYIKLPSGKIVPFKRPTLEDIEKMFNKRKKIKIETDLLLLIRLENYFDLNLN